MCFISTLKKQQEQSPLEYTIDIFNNHSAYQFYLLVLDNFDFDFQKTLNYLETNIHVYLEKVKN
jgi:hypothetical protein